MSDIIKEANDIINSIIKKEARKRNGNEDIRKEQAYKHFAYHISMSGIIMITNINAENKPELISDILDDHVSTYIHFLKSMKYKVKAKHDEIKTKFLLLHLAILTNINDVTDPAEVDKQLRKDFDSLFWKKCIFP